MHSIASKLSSHRSGVWHKIKDSKTRAFQHRGVWTMVISPFCAAQQYIDPDRTDRSKRKRRARSVPCRDRGDCPESASSAAHRTRGDPGLHPADPFGILGHAGLHPDWRYFGRHRHDTGVPACHVFHLVQDPSRGQSACVTGCLVSIARNALTLFGRTGRNNQPDALLGGSRSAGWLTPSLVLICPRSYGFTPSRQPRL